MSRTCTVCESRARDLIDEALVSGLSIRDTAKRYGVSKDAVYRHKAGHIPETLTKANAVKEVGRADALLDRVEALVTEAEGLLAYGRGEKQAHAWEGGLRELRKCLELLARVTGELDERPQVNLAVFPEWVAIRTRLLAAVESHPDARGWVLDAIDAPD